MIPYFITIILALFFSRMSDKRQIRIQTVFFKNIIRKKIQSDPFLFLTFFVLTLLSALRYGIGTDYFATYVPMINAIHNGARAFNEAGFTYFVLKLTSLTSNYQWFFIITSFLTVGLTILAMKKESKSLASSVFFYIMGGYYFYGFSGIRQALATAIFLFSIRYIRERKLINFCFCILIATGIHKMALVYFPIYWLCNIGINPQKRIIFLLLLVIARPFLGQVIRQLILLSPYGWYIGSKFDINEDALLFTLVNIGTLALGLIYCYRENDFYSKLYVNMHTIATSLAIFNSYLVVGTRIVYLFFFINVLSVPFFLSKACLYSKNKHFLIVLLIVLGVYLFYAFYVIYYIDSLNIIPYISVFSR